MNFGAASALAMSASLARIAAIVRADFLVRFRRVSTVIVFLLLSAFAYVWVPDPSTGRTLIQINGQRAIYNSGAIGLGTASLGMIFVGLFGFYVISNAIRRDVVSRCGLVVASTPMRSRRVPAREISRQRRLPRRLHRRLHAQLDGDAARARRGADRARRFSRAIFAAHARDDRFRLGGRRPLRVDPAGSPGNSATSFISFSGWRRSASSSATRRARAESTGRVISISPASVS